MLFSGLRQRRAAGPVSPSLYGMARAGPSRSIGPLPGGSMGFFRWVVNRTSMTAFTFRSYWPRDLLHVALGSAFNIGLSKLKAWAVLPSGEDNRGSGTLTSRRGTL